MFRILFVICFLLLCPLSSFGLKLEPGAINFGTMDNVAKVSKKLTFINDENEDVRLDTLRTGCGCATTGYEKGKIIKPSEKYEVTITFDPRKFKGVVRKKAFLKFSYPNSDKKALIKKVSLVANVKQVLMFEPERLDLSAKLLSVKKAFILTNKSNKPITDLKVLCDEPKLLFKIEKIDSEKPKQHRITVSIVPKAEITKGFISKVTISGEHSGRAFKMEAKVRVSP